MTYMLYLAQWIIPLFFFSLFQSFDIQGIVLSWLFSFLIIHSSLLSSVFLDLLTTVGCSRALYTQLDIFGHKNVTVSTTTHISCLDLLESQTHMSICLFEMLRWSSADISNVYVPSLIPYLPLESEIAHNQVSFTTVTASQLHNPETLDLSHTSFSCSQYLTDR